MELQIAALAPDAISDGALGDFVALVRAGGEVDNEGIEDRVCKAKQLIFLRVDCCLAGIGALKYPEKSYRERVATKAGVDLPAAKFPVEFGWVFVLPSYRRMGYGEKIAERAVALAGDLGVFATSRSDNLPMHKGLNRAGFVFAGHPYLSRRKDHELKLFLRQSPSR